MARHVHWKFINLILSAMLLTIRVSVSLDFASVEENKNNAFLFTQEISVRDSTCNVTKIEDVGTTDGVVLAWTDPVQDPGGIVYRVNVTLVEALDYEKVIEKNGNGILYVQLRATFVCDDGIKQQKDFSKGMIYVTDVSDSVPEFQQDRYEATIPENQAINTIILYNVAAIDKDQKDQVEYFIEKPDDDRDMFDGVVTLKNVEGKNRQVLDIRLLRPLDYESTTRYSFTITAKDSINYTSTCDVIIRVKDVQDCPPTFRQAIYSGRVNEMAPEGTSVVRVSAVDGDGPTVRNDVTYSIIEDPTNLFTVDNRTGVISTKGKLDIDGNSPIGTNGLVILTVQAEEYNSSGEAQFGNTSVETFVQIQIDDANDHPPQFSSTTYTGSIRGDAVAGEIVSIDGGGYISVTDQDLSPSNNHFRLHIEQDGQPWSVFETNIQSQFVQASVLIVLKNPEALEKLQNSHIKFQIVATDFSSKAQKSNTTSPSIAEIMVFVMPRTTPVPPPEAIVDLPISESDVIVFVMGFLLILNIVLTLLICRLMRRNNSGGGLGLFRRNSKYYVSGRKGVESGSVEQVVSDQSQSNGSSPAAKNDRTEVQNQTTETIFPTLLTKESQSLTLTDTAINRNTQLRNTISSAANRNRCDVTHLNEFESESCNEGNSETNGNKEIVKEDNSVQTSHSTRCDVTPLKLEDRNESATNDSSDFRNGPSKCDVIPLEKSISSTSKVLSNLLDRVHQKLATGSRNGKSETCDLRPLKDDNSSLDSSLNNSSNSSFSDKTKYGVTPLTNEKPSQPADAPSTPISPSHVNPTFIPDETETKTLAFSNAGQDTPGIVNNADDTQQHPQQQPSSYQFVPTLSPNQTQLTQTGVPPVALALPSGTNTKPRMNEADKKTNAVTVNNPMYKEDGNGNRTNTMKDYPVPKPVGIMKTANNGVNKNQIASSKSRGGKENTNASDTRNETRIQLNLPSKSTPSTSGRPDSKQVRVDYVAAAKSLLNSSMERVNSMREKEDEDKM